MIAWPLSTVGMQPADTADKQHNRAAKTLGRLGFRFVTEKWLRRATPMTDSGDIITPY